MPDKKTLDYYVAELRRIEESRQADTEKQVKKIYKELLKDLNSFLGNEYATYSNSDGVLSVSVLQEKARYTKFLQEIDQHLNSITPKVSKSIKGAVQNTYNAVYSGMVDAVTKSVDDEELAKKLKGLSLRPEVMKRAIENPISGLTLPDTLEKHRKEVIYNIKQQINIGLMTGERYDTMAKNVKKAISGDDGRGGSYGKAMNIVRTETHRVQESGMLDSAKDISKGLEGSGLVYVAIWRTMKDQKVRPSYRVHTSKGWKTKTAKTTANHQKMEGKMIIVGGKFEIEPGVFAECPGSSGTARNDCNCRCYLEYVLMTIEEFAKLTNQSVEEVKKQLGIKENKHENNENDVAKSAENSETVYIDDMSYKDWKEKFVSNEQFTNLSNNGIIKSERYMANALRRSPEHILTDDEIYSIKKNAEEIGIPLEVIKPNEGTQTGFDEQTGFIHIRGDILPDTNSTRNRDLLSQRAVLAHEYYGHFKAHPSSFRIGDWRDEFRASYRAAIDTPNLTEQERCMLMIDAYDRAKEAGVTVKLNKIARRILYGYE